MTSLCPVAPESGLSPRVRGSLGDIQHPPAHDGSIPACAGEPIRNSKASYLIWVYPRVCGGASLLTCLRPA